jgi:hypothetical protein
MSVFVPATEPRRPSNEPFVLGPLTFRPHASFDVTYATGIQINTNSANISQPGTNASPQSTVMYTISPGMAVDIGAHVTLDYTPTFIYYSNNKFKDAWNHAASLTAATAYDDWAFQLTQAFSSDTSPLSETAEQTKTTDFATALSGNYAINDKFSTQLGLNQDFNYVKGFEDSKTWSTMDWLSYSFWKRFSGGIGVGGGYVTIDNDPAASAGNPAPGDQIYETMQLKANWRATDKISLSGNIGFQNTKYDTSPGAPGTSSLSPIFGAAIQYQPFKYTQISLGVNRTISSSDYVVESQAQTTTSFNLSLNQRLLEKYNLNLSGTYIENEFSQSINTQIITTNGPIVLNSDRTDHDYSFSATLSRNIFKRGSVSVHYTYSQNSSTQTGFGSSSSQIGAQISYSY